MARFNGWFVKKKSLRWPLALAALGCLLGVSWGRLSPPKVAAAHVRIPLPPPRVVDADPACKASRAELQSQLSGLAKGFNGVAGIAVRRVGCSWLAGERTNQFFPQQSVSKLWVTLTILDAVDQNRATLDEQLTIGRKDLTLFHQPLRAAVLENGSVSVPIRELITDAITHSDNTANDRLLNRAGGPDAVRKMLYRKGLDGIRFGPGERLMQSKIAGLEWSQDLSIGRNFYDARVRVPMAKRQAALSNYLANPVDGATPAGITHALSQLASGQLLSPPITQFAMDTLSQTKSGPRRLKGGAPAGWKVYHKTGTGQELGGLSTGYNDVGILEAPDGSRYTVAVMIGQTRSPIPNRMALMQTVTAAVAQHHDRTAGAGGTTLAH